jgi:Arm DNA-binding domain
LQNIHTGAYFITAKFFAMKVSENLSILFFLETNEASQNGQTPIYIRITVNGQRKEFSTDNKIDPALWDHCASRVNGKKPRILAINNQLTHARLTWKGII